MTRFAKSAHTRWLRFLATVTLSGLGISNAEASDYGCQVLLCLANPAGPTAVSQCIPPITRLWEDLAHFRGFPSCEMAAAGGTRAEIGSSYFDACPTGTTPLSAGAYGVLPALGDPYAGIGSGDDLRPDEFGMLPAKVCVGAWITNARVWIGPEDTGGYQSIGVYDRLVVIDPSPSPRTIDVYINNLLFRRVHW